jgi:excisionase family DNA binding protein
LHTLISSREAANRLGVSQATVLRAVARGALKPATTTPGGHHRFRLDSIEALAGAPSPTLSRTVRLISTGAAARLLAVSQHTIIRACSEGRLKPDETTPGGHRRFSEERIRRLAPLTKDLVGTAGAALALGLTADRLRRAVDHGVLTPASVTPGGHRRFATSDISSRALRANGDAGRDISGDGVGNGSA